MRHKITEMENAHSDSAAQINELKKKVAKLENDESQILFNGKQRYEAVLAGESVVRWTAQDFNDFIDYYKLMDLPFFSSLEEKYHKLSPKQYFYMIIVYGMQNDERFMAKVMGVGDGTIRSMKSRIKARKRT